MKITDSKPFAASVNIKKNEVAALANLQLYDSEQVKERIDEAPHLKHPDLKKFYTSLIADAYKYCTLYARVPRVLDLGAGEGFATLLFLELGAEVTAVDISQRQLSALEKRCRQFDDMLKIRCVDANEFLVSDRSCYDIVVANSFLHHVPDYVSLIRSVVRRLAPHGCFISFQDPLQYSSLGIFSKIFGWFAYYSWRCLRGDIRGGMQRYIRRRSGIYLEDCLADNVEYHVVRDGVNQKAIVDVLTRSGLHCKVYSYFSTESNLFQSVGSFIGVVSDFALVAKKGVVDCNT